MNTTETTNKLEQWGNSIDRRMVDLENYVSNLTDTTNDIAKELEPLPERLSYIEKFARDNIKMITKALFVLSVTVILTIVLSFSIVFKVLKNEKNNTISTPVSFDMIESNYSIKNKITYHPNTDSQKTVYTLEKNGKRYTYCVETGEIKEKTT